MFVKVKKALKNRCGFQGQERDDKIKGRGNSYNYTYRMHDSRLGRFFAMDPLASKYPHYTPYSFSGNKVIHAVELEGLEEYIKIYQYENGHATHIKTIKNSIVKIVVQDILNINPLKPSIYIEKYDQRTGQLMNPSEIGQIQHQYFDKAGNRLNIRKNYEGKYVEGENEMMPLKEDNYFGSIYIGPNNPTAIVNGKEIPDYRREPQDEVDAAALRHDQGYDEVNTAGLKGALVDKKTLKADDRLVFDATIVKLKHDKKLNDNVTGKPITQKTLDRAEKIIKAFTAITVVKSLRK